ncbi:hypothetical protein [Frankia sp. QA3]|uniref:hypothetical protein n=1 Tax=Frankia sp. QA3 TaxID=710111 RepID=UPI0018DEEDF7|nr:hypothetical protein [Frankia sp. QA3]
MIRTEVNGGMFTAVAARPDRMQRARLERLLWVDPATRRSELDRLKDSAQAATLGKFKDRLAYLARLDALGPTGEWLEGIPPGKIAHFAGEARVTDAADRGRRRDRRAGHRGRGGVGVSRRQLPAVVGAVLPFAPASSVHPGRRDRLSGDQAALLTDLSISVRVARNVGAAGSVTSHSFQDFSTLQPVISRLPARAQSTLGPGRDR